MNKITTIKTIEVLRTVFARNRLTEKIVSDNGPNLFRQGSKIFERKCDHPFPITSIPSGNERFSRAIRKGFQKKLESYERWADIAK